MARRSIIANLRASAHAFVAIAVLHASAAAADAQTSATTQPAYIVRGHRVEASQRAYHARFDALLERLRAIIGEAAPDLLDALQPPAPPRAGYQVLPRFVIDPPPEPPTQPTTLSRFSWQAMDDAIDRQRGVLDRIERGLPPAGHELTRSVAQTLVSDYKQALRSRGVIDYNVQYNWMWQERIAASRDLFDRLKQVQADVLERNEIEAALAARDVERLRAALRHDAAFDRVATTADLQSLAATRLSAIAAEVRAANGWTAPRTFLTLSRDDDGWRLHVPVYTDIQDAVLVGQMTAAVERLWSAGTAPDGTPFQVAIELRRISAAELYCTGSVAAAGCHPPAPGAAIDVDAHVARFPRDGAVLTTGASAIRFVDERAIVLGPEATGSRGLAHEFGHVLGFPDAYYRGYEDAGPDGFIITELVDPSDIMGAPGSGPVLERHIRTIFAARATDAVNRSQALFAAGRYDDSLEASREASRLDAGNAMAYSNQAAALALLGRWDEAVAAAQRAVALAPDLAIARNNLAWVTAEQKTRQPH